MNLQASRLKSATNMSNRESVSRPASAAEFKARITSYNPGSGPVSSDYSHSNLGFMKKNEKSNELHSKTFH